jgi:hypothetical protein
VAWKVITGGASVEAAKVFWQMISAGFLKLSYTRKRLPSDQLFYQPNLFERPAISRESFLI